MKPFGVLPALMTVAKAEPRAVSSGPPTHKGLQSRGVRPAGHRNKLSGGDHTGASQFPFHCPVGGGASETE